MKNHQTSDAEMNAMKHQAAGVMGSAGASGIQRKAGDYVPEIFFLG